MGSFVFNLHVRCEQAEAVSKCLTALMVKDAYEPIAPQAGVPESWPFSGNTRSFYVLESSSGWVGVLDNDLILSVETAAQLSAALETYAISFHVNDSDSWHYGLTRRGSSLDEFDSSGAEEFSPFGEGPEDLNALLGESGLEDFQMAIREHSNEFPPPSDDPPSNEAGLKIFSPSESEDSNERDSTPNDPHNHEDDSFDDPNDGDLDPDLAQHVTALKPLLVPGISERQVVKVLGASAVFAEETLSEFLPLIGINPFFAHTDFRDMAEDITPQELAAESLTLHRRLDFQQQ